MVRKKDTIPTTAGKLHDLEQRLKVAEKAKAEWETSARQYKQRFLATRDQLEKFAQRNAGQGTEYEVLMAARNESAEKVKVLRARVFELENELDGKLQALRGQLGVMTQKYNDLVQQLRVLATPHDPCPELLTRRLCGEEAPKQ